MERRAKSITHDELKKTGEAVAKLLRDKHAKSFGNFEKIGYFPDIGTRGPKIQESIALDLTVQDLISVSNEANALLGSDSVSTITITGGHIIFGGNPIPKDLFSIEP